MLFRATSETILFFDKNSGDTGIISGADYSNLLNWIGGGQLNPTIIYLTSKYKLNETDKDNIVLALQNIHEPIPKAFAVPESLHIELTSRCKLNCKQCYKDRSIEKDIEYARLEILIEEAASIGVFQIAFGGGEPLLYPHLLKAIKKASGYGVGVSITTSGLGLNEQLLDCLLQAGLDHIQISLNGSSEEINSKTRDGFQSAMSALKLLPGKHKNFGINTVLSKTNIADIENIINYALRLKARNINLLRYKPAMKNGMERIELDNSDYDLIFGLFKKYNNKNFSIKVDSAFGNLIAHIYKDNLDSNYTGCTAGRRFMAVDSDGSFKVCSHLKQTESLKSILDFWQNGKLVKQIRETESQINEPCQSCNYINNCRGCRAICENKYGNFYDGEKDCFVFRRTK